MVTLFSYAREFPELGNRVYLDFTPGTTKPAAPYAIAWEAMGGVEMPLHGSEDVLTAPLRLTVYWKPTGTQTAATARRDLSLLMKRISAGISAIDTHLDGVTPYVSGSVERTGFTPPTPDKNNPEGYYSTLMLTALIHQQ